MVQPTKHKRISLWTNRRHLVQAALLALFFLLPTPIPIQGFEQGALRFDFDLWRIYFFGITLVPGLFHIFFLFVLTPLFGIALSAALYSKVFCGWVCPQNIFYELFDLFHRTLRKKYPKYRRSQQWQNAADLTLSVVVATLLAGNVVRFFIGAHPLAMIALFSSLFLFIAFDLHSLKHAFCRSACPYALIQRAFQDEQSLHVQWAPQESSPCGVCRACETACYVDLDIKKDPFDIDCTMCGACVDACANVHKPRKESPVLFFSFGERKGWFGVNSPQKGFVVAATLLFAAFFAWAVVSRPSATFRLDYPPSGTQFEPYLADGQEVNRYRLRIRNMTNEPQRYSLALSEGFHLMGEKDFTIPPFETLSQTLLVRREPIDRTEELEFQLFNEREEKPISTSQLYFRSSKR